MKHTVQSLAKQFCSGVYVPDAAPGLWQETFVYLSALEDHVAFQPGRIQALWTQYGGDLRAKLRNDALMLQVLRKALPGYQGLGLTLYRGESWFLFDQDQIGVCWTTSEASATRYARGLNAIESGGVLLRCFAPALAILAAPAATVPEGVYLCDPVQLQRLTTLALFPKQ